MIDKILSFIAPHLCCSCGKNKGILCHNCKNDIISEIYMSCVVCCCPTISNYLCKECHAPFEKAWVVGDRKDVLQILVGLYKFERAVEAYKVLGDLDYQYCPKTLL